MKKFLITIVLFMLALTVVANAELYKLIDKSPIDIVEGIEPPREVKLNDFTVSVAPIAPTKLMLPISAGERMDGNFSNWYHYDFAEDPFDGRLEVLVTGEPLPTPIMTLLIALGTAGIIGMNKSNKWSKQEKTL